MLIFLIFHLTRLNLNFERGFDTNILLDTSYLRDYYSGFDLILSDYPADRSWGYEFSLSSSFFDHYSDMSNVTFRGSFSHFKDFGKVGNFIESGVNFLWGIISPFKFFVITPGAAARIYLGKNHRINLVPSWDLNFLVSGGVYNLENLPKMVVNFNLMGNSVSLFTHLKWRHTIEYLTVSPRGAGYSSREYLHAQAKNLFAGRTALRLGRNFGDVFRIFYEFQYHFLPGANPVNIDNLIQKLDPLSEEEFAYNGVFHSFEITFFLRNFSVALARASGFKNYDIVDTSNISFPRRDDLNIVGLSFSIPLYKKSFELSMSGFFRYESNSSTLREFIYTQEEWGLGVNLGL